jgi:hypothetical protein
MQDYHLQSVQPPVVTKCVPRVSCQGGRNNSCGLGYSGSGCHLCDSDYHRVASYCVPCPTSASAAAWLFMALGAYCGNVVLLALFFRKISGLGTYDVLVRSVQVFHLLVQFDLSWTGQAAYRFTFDGKMSTAPRMRMLSPLVINIVSKGALSFAFFPDFRSISGASCGGLGLEVLADSLSFLVLLVPAGIVCTRVAWWSGKRCFRCVMNKPDSDETRESSLRRLLDVSLVLLVFQLPAVAKHAMFFRTFLWVALATLYVVGIALAVMPGIVSNGRRLLLGIPATSLSFFFTKHKRYSWWALLSAVLTTGIALAPHIDVDPPLQGFVAGLLLLFAKCLHFAYRPYRTDLADLSWMLSIGTQLAMLVVGFVLSSGHVIMIVLIIGYVVVLGGSLLVMWYLVKEWRGMPLIETTEMGTAAAIPRLKALYSGIFTSLGVVVPGFNDNRKTAAPTSPRSPRPTSPTADAAASPASDDSAISGLMMSPRSLKYAPSPRGSPRGSPARASFFAGPATPKGRADDEFSVVATPTSTGGGGGDDDDSKWRLSQSMRDAIAIEGAYLLAAWDKYAATMLGVGVVVPDVGGGSATAAQEKAFTIVSPLFAALNQKRGAAGGSGGGGVVSPGLAAQGSSVRRLFGPALREKPLPAVLIDFVSHVDGVSYGISRILNGLVREFGDFHLRNHMNATALSAMLTPGATTPAATQQEIDVLKEMCKGSSKWFVRDAKKRETYKPMWPAVELQIKQELNMSVAEGSVHFDFRFQSKSRVFRLRVGSSILLEDEGARIVYFVKVLTARCVQCWVLLGVVGGCCCRCCCCCCWWWWWRRRQQRWQPCYPCPRARARARARARRGHCRGHHGCAVCVRPQWL